MKDFQILGTLVLGFLNLGLLPLSEAMAQNLTKAMPLNQPTVPNGWIELQGEEAWPEPIVNEAEKSLGFLLFSRPITESVYLHSKPRFHEKIESLATFATLGEFEPITLAIYPLRELKDVSLQCSELVSGENRIGAESIDIRLVTHWNMRYPQYNSEGTYRRLPELLEKVDSFTSAKGECQRWWITIHVPEDAQPGLYNGSVVVREKAAETEVSVPLQLRVLDFKLLRDPNKYLSAYHYSRNPVLYHGKSQAFIDRATANEYKSMSEHGLNMLPTFQLSYDRNSQEIVIQNEREISRMREYGLTGPLPLEGGSAIERIIQLVEPSFRARPHWSGMSKLPPAVYPLIEQKFRDFKAKCERKNLPPMICCPLDEISAASQDFGVQVYAALKRSGFRTYATKNPLAPDANAYAPFVDVWCSQPFAIPYEVLAADNRHEYWSYPNHIAGELKDRDVMCRGGRMTYGYGFWRSGFTTLIPWHWSWCLEPQAFDYLRASHSGCGQRMDARGDVIPTVYWECFREGYDDSRYVYTLQQMVWERENSAETGCRKQVLLAKNLLQEIWDSIVVQDRYLSANVWPDEEFEARRWQLGLMIQELQRYPPLRNGIAPSVYVVKPTKSVTVSQSPEVTFNRQGLDVLDLAADSQQWKPQGDESKLIHDSAGEKSDVALTWEVSIDQQRASVDDGEYLMGWPRIRRNFASGELDITQYDYLDIELSVDSNRDEVQDDYTPLGICFSSYSVPKHCEFEHNLGGVQRQRTRVVYPINELISMGGKGADPWKSIEYLQLFLAEAHYPNKAKLAFTIHSIRLVRYQQPQITAVHMPRVVLLPKKQIVVQYEMAGIGRIDSPHAELKNQLIGENGVVVTATKAKIDTSSTIVLDATNVVPGKYLLEITSAAGQETETKWSGSLLCIEGPTLLK